MEVIEIFLLYLPAIDAWKVWNGGEDCQYDCKQVVKIV